MFKKKKEINEEQQALEHPDDAERGKRMTEMKEEEICKRLQENLNPELDDWENMLIQERNKCRKGGLTTSQDFHPDWAERWEKVFRGEKVQEDAFADLFNQAVIERTCQIES